MPRKTVVTVAKRNRVETTGYGQALKSLRMRAGLTQDECAEALHMSSSSAYSRYENEPRYEDSLIPAGVVAGLVPLLMGKGSPRITLDEVLAVSDAKSIVPIIRRSEQGKLDQTSAIEIATLTAERTHVLNENTVIVTLSDMVSVSEDSVLTAMIVIKR